MAGGLLMNWLKNLVDLTKIHDAVIELKPVSPKDIRFLKKYQKKTEPKESKVNHPPHYGGDTTYETIKVIHAWGLGFNLGNTVKYISRAGKKDPAKELEDLEKALFYLNREIENLKKSL